MSVFATYHVATKLMCHDSVTQLVLALLLKSCISVKI